MSEMMRYSDTQGRLANLLNYLESDGRNLSLLSDAAEEALQERRADITLDLLDRYAAIEPLPGKQMNIFGLAFMQQKDFEKSADIFSSLMEDAHEDTGLKFNLAWSRAMLKDYESALDVLDETTVSTLPQAAMLEVQILHQLSKLDQAIDQARKHMEQHPANAGLMAAISVLAMDIEDTELAQQAAEIGGNHPDALTTKGLLSLGDDNPEQALELFNTALDINQHGPRSWIGKGLAQLVTGDVKSGAENIDRGADMFGSHIGSWIAAGWAYFIIDDLKSSKARFETAMAIDDNFAESHGSLAVIKVLEGDAEAAKIGIRTALGLDKDCFSAALAQTLIMSSKGNTEGAKKIFDRALNTPIDESGRTIAQSMIRMGLSVK